MKSEKLNDTKNEDVSVRDLEQRLHRLLNTAERDDYVKEQIEDAIVRIEKRKSTADICSVFDD